MIIAAPSMSKMCDYVNLLLFMLCLLSEIKLGTYSLIMCLNVV